MTETVIQESIEPQSAAQAAPELTVVDLQNLRAVIDVACRRGAFGAAEMTAVGTVFNKLDAFLSAALPKDDSAKSEQ